MTEDLVAELARERAHRERLEQAVAELSGRVGYGAAEGLDRHFASRNPAAAEISAEQRRAQVRVIAEFTYDGRNAQEIRQALLGTFSVAEDRVTFGHRTGPPWPLCVVRGGFATTVRPGDSFAIDSKGRVHVGEIEGGLEWTRARERAGHDAVGPGGQVFDRNHHQAQAKALMYAQAAREAS
jgi:hypothetical protein